MTKQGGAGPLRHIKVLDLSRILAGPWASQVLADLGAEVIKVERPGAGDDTRAWGPPFLVGPDGKATRESGYFLAANRGKRSITISLDHPEGQALVRRLACRADIVLENFKVGTLARFGLDAASLQAENPRLVYCSITGFGQDGPRAAHPAYDFAIQAMGGLMSITGEADGKPGGGPQKVGVPIIDLSTGLYAAVGILAALTRRAETGVGETIDLAMLDVQVALLANQAMNHLLTGATPRRQGNGHPNIMPQGAFYCRDGQVVLAVGNDGQFLAMCHAIGRDDLANDPRFAANAGRVLHRDELLGAIAGVFAATDRASLLHLLIRAGVPCGPINSVPEALADLQVQHRSMVVRTAHASGVAVDLLATPLRLMQAPVAPPTAPPLLGQHTAEVLGELGLTAEAITALAVMGAI